MLSREPNVDKNDKNMEFTRYVYMRNSINIYTDGSCKPNPGKGGWGWVVIADDGTEYFDWGGVVSSTNQRMEMTAILEALRHSIAGQHYIIHSDSKYCVNGLIEGGVEGILSKSGIYSGWMKAWLSIDYKGKKNVDLWRQIDVECRKLCDGGSTLTFKWVRGHCGNYGNELADKLANKGAMM